MTRRRGLLGLLLAALLGVMLPAGAAGAAPGDVTRVAGQGPDANCTADDLRVDPITGKPGLPQDDGTPGLEDARWNYHANFGALAAAGGRLYVAQANRVRGPDGLVVGFKRDPDDPADAKPVANPDGAPATTVNLGVITALAVDPGANHAYLAEKVTELVPRGDLLVSKEGTRVWHVGLGTPSPVLRRVATVGPGGGLAVDGSGRVFIGEESGEVSVAAPGGAPARVASFAPNTITSLAVDPSGTNLFATDTDADKILHINLASGGGSVALAGAAGEGDSGDNGLAPLARLDGPRWIGVDRLGVYFVDQPQGEARVRRIDLETLTINTVVGPGAAGKAAGLSAPDRTRLAVDRGNVYLGDFNQCQVLMVESAVAATLATVDNPVGPLPPNNTGGTGGTGDSGTNSNADQGASAPNPAPGPSGDAGSSAATDPAGSGSTGAENQTRIISSTTGAENQTGIISSTAGAESQAAPGPGTQGGAGGAQTPAQSFQPSANTPAAAPSANPSSAPAPQPPAASEAVAVADPGAPASPPPQPASVTGPALAPASPPAAGNVAPAGTYDPDPARGVPRYTMVRAQDGSELGAAAAMVGGVLAVIFCVMLAAPAAVARPRPRPKGAY